MATATKYEQKHPLYSESASRRKMALDLYEGGVRVEQGGYLIRHPFETEAQWGIRQCRATYLNYAAPIVDIFASFINEGRPPRTLHGVLILVENDVDRIGTTANAFFSDVTRLTAAGGIRFVLVDMEPAKGSTQAENDAAGRRNTPYFVSIDPDDVWDWEFDERGLTWVVLHSTGMVRPAGAFSEPKYHETVTLWTRVGWARYRREMATGMAGVKTGGEWTLDAEGKNTAGVVPLVPFFFEAATPMTGIPATDDVLSLILRIYQHGSEYDKKIFDAAVPLMIINGLERSQWEDFIRASSSVLMSEQPGQLSGQYVETSGSSFAATVEAIDRDVSSVREIALRMVRPMSGSVESADSKKQDSKQLDTQLAMFARKCASAETQCWKIAAAWMGETADDIAAPYTEEYDVDGASEAVISALISFKSQGVISAETLRETKAVGALMPDGWTPEEEVARIAREQGVSTSAAGGLTSVMAGILAKAGSSER